MANPTLIKQGVAEGAIPAYRIVKPGGTDTGYALATAAADALCGVSESVPATSGERLDVVKTGIADVEFGGQVSRGQPVTSDASGKAVAAAPAAGSNVRIIGFAEASAVAGDISPVLLAPGVVQG